MDVNSRALAMAAAGAEDERIYVEDVFSTYLYTGNGSIQTITNGIDLSGKGGLTWIKGRSGATGHRLTDTARSATKSLASDSTAAEATESTGLTSFSSTGFAIGADADYNTSAATYCSWTFRKQPKFFDVVTWTGDGTTSDRRISHSLGTMPGMILYKCTSNAGDWFVRHYGTETGNYNPSSYYSGRLYPPSQFFSGPFAFDSMSSMSSSIVVGRASYTSDTNASGRTYVAYLFAHDPSANGVIQCNSYIGNGSATGPTVNLGWEPQYVMIGRADSTPTWYTFDTMRGMTADGSDAILKPHLADAETSGTFIKITSTGFQIVSSDATVNASAGTYLYTAIRRGPMKTPTVGTSVFGLSARSGTGANATVTGGQVDDAVIIKNRGSAVGDLFAARLTGIGYLETSSTAAEVAAGTTILQANPWDVMDGVKVGTTSTITNASGNTFINYFFRRAPGFFDVVCYTGTGATQTLSHSLAKQPELIIIKNRNGVPNVANWMVSALVLSGGNNNFSVVGRGNLTDAFFNNETYFSNTPFTTSTFFIGVNAGNSGVNYIAYLFATAPGVSKVGSYTGTGTTLNIDCGFTAGARFVLIKRTDFTGDWFVWDTARGIVSGNDPSLLLNSAAAEVTNTDYIDPLSSGFQISPTAPAAINASGGSFVFLAIA